MPFWQQWHLSLEEQSEEADKYTCIDINTLSVDENDWWSQTIRDRSSRKVSTFCITDSALVETIVDSKEVEKFQIKKDWKERWIGCNIDTGGVANIR